VSHDLGGRGAGDPGALGGAGPLPGASALDGVAPHGVAPDDAVGAVPGELPTIYDVARLAGVSIASV